MCVLHMSQLMHQVRPKFKWFWRPYKKAKIQFYSSESRPGLTLTQTEDSKPSYVFEDGFVSNIARTLTPQKKANLEKLAKYLCESPDLHSPKIKERLLVYIASNRSQIVPSSLFLIDPNVAKAVFSILKPYFKQFSGHILEGNAGPGVLTYLLMKEKLKRLRIYESDHGFLSDLYGLKKKLKSDAEILEHNLLRMRWMMNRDLEDNKERIKSAFKGIEPKPWEETDPVLRLFIILPHENFLLLQMYDLLMQGGIYAYGRPELFVIIPAVNFNILSVIGKSRFIYKPLLFNLLFDFSVLEKIPETAILPWRYKRKTDMKELNHEEDYMILVKVTPKQMLHPFIKSNQLKSLLFFVKILVYRQGGAVIPTLENWAPGFGLKLLALGYTIYTPCKSLTIQQILDLYQLFISSPEFPKESFYHMMEHDHMSNEIVKDMLFDLKVGRTSSNVDTNPKKSLESDKHETIINEASLNEELLEEDNKRR